MKTEPLLAPVHQSLDSARDAGGKPSLISLAAGAVGGRRERPSPRRARGAAPGLRSGLGRAGRPVSIRLGRRSLLPGVGFGLALWAVGLVGLLPRHRAGRKGWKATVPAQVVNVLSHAVFGVAVQLAAQEAWLRPRRDRNARIG